MNRIYLKELRRDGLALFLTYDMNDNIFVYFDIDFYEHYKNSGIIQSVRKIERYVSSTNTNSFMVGDVLDGDIEYIRGNISISGKVYSQEDIILEIPAEVYEVFSNLKQFVSYTTSYTPNTQWIMRSW